MAFGAALIIGGLALAAQLATANMPFVGQADFSTASIKLSTMQGLPSSMRTERAEEVVVAVSNEGPAVSAATFKVRLTATGLSLSDPSVSELRFKDPDTGSEELVALSAVGGSLEGVLKSNWAIPESYSRKGTVKLTLHSDAPAGSYGLSFWVEGTSVDTAGGAPSASR